MSFRLLWNWWCHYLHVMMKAGEKVHKSRVERSSEAWKGANEWCLWCWRFDKTWRLMKIDEGSSCYIDMICHSLIVWLLVWITVTGEMIGHAVISDHARILQCNWQCSQCALVMCGWHQVEILGLENESLRVFLLEFPLWVFPTPTFRLTYLKCRFEAMRWCHSRYDKSCVHNTTSYSETKSWKRVWMYWWRPLLLCIQRVGYRNVGQNIQNL